MLLCISIGAIFRTPLNPSSSKRNFESVQWDVTAKTSNAAIYFLSPDMCIVMVKVLNVRTDPIGQPSCGEGLDPDTPLLELTN